MLCKNTCHLYCRNSGAVIHADWPNLNLKLNAKIQQYEQLSQLYLRSLTKNTKITMRATQCEKEHSELSSSLKQVRQQKALKHTENTLLKEQLARLKDSQHEAVQFNHNLTARLKGAERELKSILKNCTTGQNASLTMWSAHAIQQATDARELYKLRLHVDV